MSLASAFHHACCVCMLMWLAHVMVCMETRQHAAILSLTNSNHGEEISQYIMVKTIWCSPSKYPDHSSLNTKQTQNKQACLQKTPGRMLYTDTHDSASSLTREQSFSTASSMSSWCPIFWTPNFSRSWEVNWSRSKPDKCHSETGYWCKGASRPGRRTQIFQPHAGHRHQQRAHVVRRTHACTGRRMQSEHGRTQAEDQWGLIVSWIKYVVFYSLTV